MKYQKIDMAHLHLHSSYSELDAISKIPEIVKRASEFGHKSLGLTDHGTIAGIPEFHSECHKAGIKPILGCEFYFVPDAEEARKNKQRKAHHLLLLAMNNEGWTNIKKLTTEAAKKFYYWPKIDYKDLEKHSNGIICLSACLKSPVTEAVANEEYEKAVMHAMRLKKIFGDRFYFELQDGGIDVQVKVNDILRRMSEKLGIKCVAAQDSHYVNRDDVESHEAIWCIRTGHNFDIPKGYNEKGKRPYYSTNEYWMKDGHHILNELLTTQSGERRKTTLLQKEIEESAVISDLIEDISIEKRMRLPKYEYIPEFNSKKSKKLQSYDFLKKLVIAGYARRYNRDIKDAPEEHIERLKKELNDIKSAGLSDYFLIIWDIVDWAKKNDVPTGPGRGSAAGSMVSYCIGITSIDPIHYGLIWERFYNVGRKGSMADIDLDFGRMRRDDVIEYIKSRFGEDRVAQMVTFNTLKARAALKDTAKLLGSQGMPFEDANVMTKFVSDKPDTTIQKSLTESEKLKEYEENFPKLFKIAQMLEGCPKSSGKHAAGIIISDTSFETGDIPLRWDTKDKKLITEWDGVTLDSMGYLKVDVLGLTTMDVLDGIRKDVNDKYGKSKNNA